MNRRNAISALLAFAVFRPSVADERYPTRPIKIIVPFAAGSIVDAHMRKIGPHLANLLGQSVIIDNRPGGSGTLGVAVGAQAKPDGYTITVGTSSNLAVSPALGVKLSYDPVKDLQPITQYARTSLLLVANPELGVSSMKELITLAKRKPGELNYGTGAATGIGRLAFELLEHEAGIELMNIPYKSAAVLPVLANEVPLAMDFAITSGPHIRAGKLKGLVVTGSKRIASLPNVPTVSEVGLPGAEVYGWGGFVVPAGTPSSVVARLNSAIHSVLQRDDVRSMLENEGAEVVTGPGSDPRNVLMGRNYGS
jgi:tripartite-type tricarboxylate transporter receptor subunit TctC